MGQALLAPIETPPPAAASIEEIHSLFGNTKIGRIYDNLDIQMKKAICTAAGLKAEHLGLKMNEFNCLDKAKLHKGVHKLELVVKTLAGHSIRDFK